MLSGTNFISHNNEEPIEVKPCVTPGCYSHPVVYNASMKQIIALIQRSTKCRQFIQVHVCSYKIRLVFIYAAILFITTKM